ncbi:TMEM165/GDT1 family protein [Neisseria leonii]|uniref:GDT1 family protein n=1 Tax=Neisseria leonii TaxID=2995413 RepID=A0A9X4IEK1_9NEIS|nr:TMEM165/GDT1 family protein [Neisseria sp. 51.81]MDD9328183.1 TMEM165/GDT1 family protein [Neisseria sp. 51.81]
MEAFWYSTAGVLFAEIGDKTQLLALFLAARFPQKKAVIAGILAATLLNHAVSAVFGAWLAQAVPPGVVKWLVGLSFIAVGLWLLVPDKDGGGDDGRWLKYGAFAATAVLFFLAEIGDKTQIATVLLAAKYQAAFAVMCGSTLGLMLANVPAVYLGDALLRRIPAQTVRRTACAAFCLLGVLTLAGGDLVLG